MKNQLTKLGKKLKQSEKQIEDGKSYTQEEVELILELEELGYKGKHRNY